MENNTLENSTLDHNIDTDMGTGYIEFKFKDINIKSCLTMKEMLI